MVKATETLGSFDVAAKAFGSLQRWTPEYTADSITIYVELLKTYLAFFLPSARVDYPFKESNASYAAVLNIMSPKEGEMCLSSEKLIGKSWNIFVAK
jgi:hypothetical protein